MESSLKTLISTLHLNDLNNNYPLFKESFGRYYLRPEVSKRLCKKVSLVDEKIYIGDCTPITKKAVLSYLTANNADIVNTIEESTVVVSNCKDFYRILYSHRISDKDKDHQYLVDNFDVLEKMFNINQIQKQVLKHQHVTSAILNPDSAVNEIICYLKASDKSARMLAREVMIKTDWTNNELVLKYILQKWAYELEEMPQSTRWTKFRNSWGVGWKFSRDERYYLQRTWDDIFKASLEEINKIHKYENSNN